VRRLKVILVKPSKYGIDGYVDRFRRGYMPNAALPYLKSMTPPAVAGAAVEVHAIDEYVQTDLRYLKLLEAGSDPVLVAFVGVQSHQFHRSLDLAAYALKHGVRNCVIGGPHPMTCDTTAAQNRGVSFAQSEAEMIWDEILRDAVCGELKPVYSGESRWQSELATPVITPPSRRDLSRYAFPIMGLHPARGCPFTCNFCSVIKIAGRRIRTSPVATTLESLRLAKAAGVRYVMFTSDNFNKYPDAMELLQAMVDEKLNLGLFVQCDAQIVKQDALLELLGRAGCFNVFVGVESFNRKTLLAARKTQNHPRMYGQIVEKCRAAGIMSYFSSILGFPEDTSQSNREHLEIFMGLAPDLAAFQVLTPIPGTEQYGDFLKRGLITEKNLDRFDSTCATWAHPNLTGQEIEDAMYACYRRFYSAKRIARNILSRSIRSSLYSGFVRYSAYRRYHPMSGGIGRRRLDHVSDYAALRREQYGFDRAPLPACLDLSTRDARLNDAVNVG
jgi:Radical SAM superfamily